MHNLPAAGLQLALRKRATSSNYILEHEKETKKPQTSRQETSWKVEVVINLDKYRPVRRKDYYFRTMCKGREHSIW